MYFFLLEHFEQMAFKFKSIAFIFYQGRIFMQLSTVLIIKDLCSTIKSQVNNIIFLQKVVRRPSGDMRFSTPRCRVEL